MTGRAARRLFDRLVVLGAAREFSGRPDVPAVRPMSAAARRRRRSGDESLDVELLDLPPAARWREWMLRVEAAIFASPKPVPREALVRLVGEACRFDDLIADLIHELRGRPYDLTLVAGGYALRTKTRFAPAIRAAHPGRAGDAVGELTKTETFALTAIAYLQPVTRGEISKLAGREISRDVIAALKRHGLIDGAIRAPQPGAPFAYVTTRKFLEAFGFASLRDLPDLEQLKAEGLLQRGQGEDDLDSALGLGDAEDDDACFGKRAELDERGGDLERLPRDTAADQLISRLLEIERTGVHVVGLPLITTPLPCATMTRTAVDGSVCETRSDG